MSKLSSSMQKRPTTLDELERGTTKNVDKMPGNIASWMRTSTAGEEFFLPTIHHEIAKLREDLYGRAEHAIATHKDNPRFNELGFSHMGPVPTYELLERAGDILEKLKALHPEPKAFTKYKKNIEGNLNFLVRNMAVNCTAAALKAAGVEPPKAFVTGSNAVKTKFFTDAEALDKSRSEPYWGTTRELLARAGAAYVYDRLAALDVRSDYLVYGSDEGRYANHPLGNPNPEAEDRAMLAPYFADVIEDYRLRCVQEKEPETADLEM